jgi:hypothetical protein
MERPPRRFAPAPWRAASVYGWPGATEIKSSAWSYEDVAAFGPLRSFVGVHSLAASARRGRDNPAGAHSVHCAARSGVAPQNSLRSLRSLRSDNRGESVHEARAAHAPTPALRCSPPPKSPPPGSPCREAHGGWCSLQTPPRWLQRRVRAGCGAPLRRRGAQGSWPRAQRALPSDSSRLSERSERIERSEFCDGPRDRAPQGSRSAAPTASVKRRGLPARGFARADRRMQSGHSTATKGRRLTTNGHARFMHHGSRDARWS